MIKECKNNTRQTGIQKPPDNGKQCRFHSNIFYSAKNRSISFFFLQIHLPPSLWPLELNGPLSGSFCCCAFKKGLLHKWNEKLRFAVHSPNSLVAKQHILTSSQNNFILKCASQTGNIRLQKGYAGAIQPETIFPHLTCLYFLFFWCLRMIIIIHVDCTAPFIY